MVSSENWNAELALAVDAKDGSWPIEVDVAGLLVEAKSNGFESVNLLANGEALFATREEPNIPEDCFTSIDLLGKLDEVEVIVVVLVAKGEAVVLFTLAIWDADVVSKLEMVLSLLITEPNRVSEGVDVFTPNIDVADVEEGIHAESLGTFTSLVLGDVVAKALVVEVGNFAIRGDLDENAEDLGASLFTLNAAPKIVGELVVVVDEEVVAKVDAGVANPKELVVVVLKMVLAAGVDTLDDNEDGNVPEDTTVNMRRIVMIYVISIYHCEHKYNLLFR